MSVIGPRAYLPSELDEMNDYAPIILRHQSVKTGWWQVMGRHGTTFEQRLRMDEEHQQLVAVDGHLYPDENSLGGSGRERRVDENQTGGKGGRGAGGGWRRLISGRILL